MSNRKRPVEIWPLKSIRTAPIPFNDTYDRPVVKYAGFEMPDGTKIEIEYETEEEYRSAQFKARATARAIVRAEHPQAFQGLKA